MESSPGYPFSNQIVFIFSAAYGLCLACRCIIFLFQFVAQIPYLTMGMFIMFKIPVATEVDDSFTSLYCVAMNGKSSF